MILPFAQYKNDRKTTVFKRFFACKNKSAHVLFAIKNEHAAGETKEVSRYRLNYESIFDIIE